MISNELLEALKKELTSETTITGEFPSEKRKLFKHLGDLPDLFEQYDVIVAGGAITSMFTGNEVNDIDIYFRDKESFSKFFLEVVSGRVGYFSIAHHTDKSILFTDHDNKYQLIVYKFFPEIQDIFNDFDFTVNMGAFDFKNDCFVLHKDFMKHNSQRYIGINENTAYPLVSVLRIDKYRQKGYSVSKPQLLKLLFRINNLKLDSWEDALSQVAGMYGIDPEKIFDKTKEFSIDEAITQLDALETMDNTWTQSGLDMKELTESLKDVFIEDVKEVLNSGEYLWDCDAVDKVLEGEEYQPRKKREPSRSVLPEIFPPIPTLAELLEI